METTTTHHFGNFLEELRKARIDSKASVESYLSRYKLNISSTYYRDIEAGRKLPHYDSLPEIISGLEIDNDEQPLLYLRCYSAYLQDIMPERICKSLLKPIVDEASALDKAQFAIVENAYAKSLERDYVRYESPTYKVAYRPDIATVNFLKVNTPYLALVHSIYMSESLSFEQVENVAKANGITDSMERIVFYLTDYRIADVDSETKTVRRLNMEFELPVAPESKELKDLFVQIETNKLFEEKKTYSPELMGAHARYNFSGITSINLKKQKQQFENILGLLVAAFSTSTEPLENPDTVPYFMSVSFCSCEEYDIKKKEDIL